MAGEIGTAKTVTGAAGNVLNAAGAAGVALPAGTIPGFGVATSVLSLLDAANNPAGAISAVPSLFTNLYNVALSGLLGPQIAQWAAGLAAPAAGSTAAGAGAAAASGASSGAGIAGNAAGLSAGMAGGIAGLLNAGVQFGIMSLLDAEERERKPSKTDMYDYNRYIQLRQPLNLLNAELADAPPERLEELFRALSEHDPQRAEYEGAIKNPSRAYMYTKGAAGDFLQEQNRLYGLSTEGLMDSLFKADPGKFQELFGDATKERGQYGRFGPFDFGLNPDTEEGRFGARQDLLTDTMFQNYSGLANTADPKTGTIDLIRQSTFQDPTTLPSFEGQGTPGRTGDPGVVLGDMTDPYSQITVPERVPSQDEVNKIMEGGTVPEWMQPWMNLLTSRQELTPFDSQNITNPLDPRVMALNGGKL